MRSGLLHLFWMLPAVGLAAACTSDDGGDTPATTTTTATTSTTTTSTGSGASGGGGAGGEEPTCNYETGDGGSCQAPGYDPPTTDDTVDSVGATISDLAGDPVAGLLVDICGLDVCYSGQTNASGEVFVNAQGDTITEVRMLYGDGIETVRLYARLPTTPAAQLGDVRTARLPAQGPTLVPGQSATSGDVTLSLDAAAFVEYNALLYCSVEEQALRAATIPADGSVSVPALEPSFGFEMAFGLAPIDTQICPPAQMTVPNTPGWTANAEVEFWYQGTRATQQFAPYGDWTRISDGVVSTDGLTVSTNSDEGIPELGVIAVRLKPQ